MRIFTIFIVALIVLFAGERAEGSITCEAGHFATGASASLTCNFHQDIAGSQYHVYVVHYPFPSQKYFSGNDVLKCSGLSRVQPQCTVAEGYQFNNEITDRLTVGIPDVKENFAGSYVCQLVPPGGILVKMCNLTVEGKRMIETTTVPMQRVNDTYATILEQPAESNALAHNTTHAVLSGVIVILLVVIAYLGRRIYKSEYRLRSEDPEAATAMLPKKLTRDIAIATEESVAIHNLREVLDKIRNSSADGQPESGYNSVDIDNYG